MFTTYTGRPKSEQNQIAPHVYSLGVTTKLINLP